jgi:hypothetical protein
MIFFTIVRVLDILTTLIGFNHGLRELNPFNRGLLQSQVGFVLFQTFLILVVAYLYRYRLVREAVSIFTWINLLVVIMNITLIVLTFLNV